MPTLADIRNQRTQLVIGCLLDELEDLGIWIYHVSQHGSVYLKFEDESLRSIRVADHPGRQKYRYKWNLDLKDSKSKKVNDRGIVRNYYGIMDVESLVQDIRSAANGYSDFSNLED